MIKKGIIFPKKEILEYIINLSPDSFKILTLSEKGIENRSFYQGVLKASSAINSFKPSNTVSGMMIISSKMVNIGDEKRFMDENVIDFLIVVKQESDSIPSDSILYIKKNGKVTKRETLFFLIPETIEIEIEDSQNNAVVVFRPGENISFRKETLKLIEDAGWNPVETIIIKDVLPSQSSVGNFVERLELISENITTIIFARDIKSSVQAMIERVSGKNVIGREELVISIFEKRADGSSGKIRVAAGTIAREKKVFKNKINGLSRIKGGIGLKGPGETKEEERKRILKNKEKDVKIKLLKEKERLESQRKFRKKSEYPTVSIVGYTNAGKSTLFNALLGENVVQISNEYFSSIDPKIRTLYLFGEKLFLVDTVGVIDGMTDLVFDAFNPTLAEIAASDLVLHIIDSTDSDYDFKRNFVNSVLDKIGVSLKNVLTLYSKKEGRVIPVEQPSSILYSSNDKKDITLIKKAVFNYLFHDKVSNEV